MNNDVRTDSDAAMRRPAYANATSPSRAEAYGIKLIRYLSGGGLAAFTRSAEEEKADAKQDRFLFFAAILAVAWLVFWIV